MAKFFVGQRVRITKVERSENGHMVGREGHINKIMDLIPFLIHGLDIAPIFRELGIDGEHFIGWGTDQLEPILPEGSAPSDFTFQQLMDSLQGATA